LVATKAMEAGFEKSPAPSTVILGSNTNRAPGTAIRVAAARVPATSFPAIGHLFSGGGAAQVVVLWERVAVSLASLAYAFLVCAWVVGSCSTGAED
jgi:hypothetical protein